MEHCYTPIHNSSRAVRNKGYTHHAQAKPHRSVITIFLLALTLFVAPSAFASHFRYGDISWRVVEDDPTGRTIEFKVNTGWRLNAVSDPYLYFGDGQAARITTTRTNINGEYTYATGTVRHTYASNGNFTAYYSSCCKIGNLSNNANGYWEMYTTVNVGTGNNSPVTTMPAIINVQTNQSSASFFIPATDPDGDQLTFELANTSHRWGVRRPQSHPSGISINSSTGEVTFNTQGKNIGTLWNTAVAISDGQTTVVVDYIIKITQTSTPPQFDYGLTPANNFVYNASPGQTITFDVAAFDTDPGSSVTLNGLGVPPGAAITQPFGGSGNPQSHTFSWTPQPNQFGTYVMNFVAQDNNGVQAQTSVSIIVSLKPQFDVPPTPAEGSANHNILTPGVPFSYTVQASDPDPDDVVRIIKAEGKNMMGAKIPLYAGASLSPLPTAAGNPTSGTFFWTPQVSDWGHKHVFFTAEDSYGDQKVHEVPQLVNTLPYFTSTPSNTEAIVGQQYTYLITAEDPDIPYGDMLMLVGTQLPSWLTVIDNGNGTAILTGTPALSDVGPNQVELAAEDLHHHHYLAQVPLQQFAINVTDCQVLAVCQDVTLQLDANGQATLSGSDLDGGSSVTCGSPQLSVSQANFDCSHLGDNLVTLTVTDEKGNSDSCQATITVEDVSAPVMATQDITVYLDASGNASITPADVDNGSSDNCGLTSLSIDVSQFDCSNVGPNTVTLTGTDASGNGGSQGPTLDGLIGHWTFEGANPLADLTGNWGDLIIERDASISNGELDLNSGSHVRTSSYLGGNTIQDKTLISFLTMQSLGVRSGSPLAIDGKTNDNFDAIVYAERQTNRWMPGSSYFRRTQDPVPGYAESNVGEPIMMAITYQQLSATQLRIIIYRNGAEIGNYVSGNPTSWPANNVEMLFGPRHTVPSIRGSIDALVDEAMLFNRPLSAAEIQGLYDSQSSSGGSGSTATSTVTVVDSTAPTAVCQNITIQLDPLGLASIQPIDLDGGSSDACGIAGFSVDQDQFDCSDVGANMVTLTVTDNNGNQSTCQATVTVQDTVAPNAVCQDITVYLDANGDASITAEDIDGGSNDACGIQLAVKQDEFNCSSLGDVLVELFVTDPSGNKSSCIASVTVKDTVAPLAICQDITVQLNENGEASITAADVDGGSTDACGIATIAIDKATFTCAETGPNQVVLTVIDNNGNQSSCTATVTVEDNVAPDISCTDATVYLDENGQYSFNPSAVLLDPASAAVREAQEEALQQEVADAAATAAAQQAIVDALEQDLTNAYTAYNEIKKACRRRNSRSNRAKLRNAIKAIYQLKEQTHQAKAELGPLQVDVAAAQDALAEFQAQPSLAMATDACGVDTMFASQLNFDCAHVGINAVTISAVDIYGNVGTCTAMITVVDNAAPTIVASITCTPKKAKKKGYKDDDDDDGPKEHDIAFSAADNCSVSSVKAVIKTAFPDDYRLKLKTSSKKRIKIDTRKRGKVQIEGPDPQAMLAQIFADGGWEVQQQQGVKMHRNKSKFEFKFDKNSGDLTQIFGPEIKMETRAIDASGNEAIVYAFPTWNCQSHDDDDDYDDDDDRRRRRKSDESETESGVSTTTVFNDQNVMAENRLKAYPNPFQNALTVHYQIIQDDQIQITLLDGNGRLVQSVLEKDQTAGTNQKITIPTSDLAEGMYMVVLKTGDTILHQRVIHTK